MHSLESAQHKDAIDVRVVVKNCDISKDNPKAHVYFATIANLWQMCSIYPAEFAIMTSCDSKAKLHIGG